MRHPLHAAVAALQMLGAVLLALAAAPALSIALQWGMRGIALAALVLAPGMFYLVAASRTARRPRRWLLVLCAIVAGLTGVGLLMLLALLVMQFGVRDLLLRPRNVGFPHIIAAVLLILTVCHGWLVHRLIQAYDADLSELPGGRGFEPAALPPAVPPLPVLPVDDPAAVTAPPASPPRQT